LTSDLPIFNDAVAYASMLVNFYFRQLEAAQERLPTPKDEALNAFLVNAQLLAQAIEKLDLNLTAKQSALEQIQSALGVGEGGSKKRSGKNWSM
jgi:capsule polysaccharide export protein KpsE/RkpR